MANGYFERGEVYWVGKVGVATLGVVVSSNRDNSKQEYVALAAICGEEPCRGVMTEGTGRTSWVCCSNIRTVHKKELRTLVGQLTPSEMKQVDTHLEEFFDLGYEDEDKEKELIRLRGQVVQYISKIAHLEEGIMARSIEMNNWKKKYDTAVDRIVDLELDRDIATRIAERKVEPEVPVVEEAVEPPAEEPKTEPKEEFVRQVVNINTATGKEIREKLGLSQVIAYSITGYRKKNGLFVDVEELLEVSKVTKPIFERIKDYVLIEEPKLGVEWQEATVVEPEESEEAGELEVPEEKKTVRK